MPSRIAVDGLTIESIAKRVVDAGLVNSWQLDEVQASLGSRPGGARELLQALMRRGMLTKYQVDLLRSNEETGYFYGDYKVLYLAGQGTFARVYRAGHRTTGQVVAVKVLRSHFSDNPAQYGLFVREGNLGCTLRHPNIVPIHEVCSRGSDHFLVMEFVEGATLYELLKARKTLDPVGATRLMAGIARGLRYAFVRSVTHRDLRLSNVLVSSRGEAKLADFGLAGVDQGSETGESGVAAGRTVEYASLEKATGVRRDDARSDVFFAGCLYYHMLCGRSPFREGRNRRKAIDRSQFQEIVPIQQILPSLPLFVASVVNRAMALAPSRRYQTASELLFDVESTLKRFDAQGGSGPVNDSAEPGLAERDIEDRPPQRCVLVVEANTQMQDILRESLKRAGYQVLLTGDPERALKRLSQNAGLVDCMVFDAQEVGEPALICFNHLLVDPQSRSLPALLLLGENQRTWSARANISAHRRAICLPITMKRFRAVLEELLVDRVR